jgi:predicted TIM-barrel fold metal-dependent hydrolase
MRRFPNLKIVTHHFGAMIPFFESRMELAWASLGTRGGPEDYSETMKNLGKPLVECFKEFYADTALSGGRA